MTALGFQTRGRHQTSPATFTGVTFTWKCTTQIYSHSHVGYIVLTCITRFSTAGPMRSLSHFCKDTAVRVQNMPLEVTFIPVGNISIRDPPYSFVEHLATNRSEIKRALDYPPVLQDHCFVKPVLSFFPRKWTLGQRPPPPPNLTTTLY